MTEAEAKTKWCPFARLIGGSRAKGGTLFDVTPPHNRVGVSGEESPSFTRGTLCIGSACMAWRWSGYRAEDGKWVRKTAGGPWDPIRAEGYCGLAGTV